MENLWNDPVEKQKENQKILKTFSVEESRAIDERINKSIADADRISRRNEANAMENASRAFLTF